jgi:hypothetical protein
LQQAAPDARPLREGEEERIWQENCEARSSLSSEATAGDRHGRVVRAGVGRARAAVRQRLVAANHQAGERKAPGTVDERSAPPQWAAHDETTARAAAASRKPEKA